MSTLRDRFDDAAVVEALLRQRLLRGDRSLAEQFAKKGQVVEYEPGGLLIKQGAWDADLHFILAGSFEIIINGQHLATRSAGEHVGELAGLNPARARTATLRATGQALVVSVTAADVNEIAGADAEFWKAAAEVVGERLDQRNASIGAANEHPRIFVISSSEGLPVARLVRQELDSGNIQVHVWNRGTFSVSDYALSSLEDAIEAADFAIAVVRADDTIVTRDQTAKVARDNVHLEYGIAVGKLGRERAFLLVDAADNVKLPSDLAGLTTLRYRGGSTDEMERTVAKACDGARSHIGYLGVRRDRKAC
jgi:CRP/FNR family cyclic AMP-dependent transcriptional regulator